MKVSELIGMLEPLNPEWDVVVGEMAEAGEAGEGPDARVVRTHYAVESVDLPGGVVIAFDRRTAIDVR